MNNGRYIIITLIAVFITITAFNLHNRTTVRAVQNHCLPVLGTNAEDMRREMSVTSYKLNNMQHYDKARLASAR